MSFSRRSIHSQRSRRNRIANSPEALEQRRLLDGDGGRIWIDPFEDYNGDGIQQSENPYYETYRTLASEVAVYKDDGDGTFDSEVDELVETNSGDLYADLDFGRYFAVGQVDQSSSGVQTVITTPAVQVLDLTADNPIQHAQFGFWSTGTLTLTVYHDTNANGQRDAGENLLSGDTTIKYRDGDETLYSSFELSDGITHPSWWREHGAVQVFSIGKQRDDGLLATTPDPVTIEYESATRYTAEFGVIEGATIQVAVYSDVTGDGRTADDESLSINSHNVNIKVTGETLNGTVIDTDFKSLSSDGRTISDLMPGSYTLELVSDSDSLRLFSQEPLTRELEVNPGDSLYVDFSAFFGRSIDKSIDSLKQYLKENDYAGIQVELFGDDGDGVFDPAVDTFLASATTDADAHFTLPSFGPGSYFLASRLGATYTPLEVLFANAYSPESNDTFAGHQSIPTSSIEGDVYVDANFNNLYEPRELGLQGVKLTLQGVDIFGNAVEEEETTRYDGDYRFYNLMPGTYSIIQEQPAGYENGLETAGDAGGTPSANRIDNIVIVPSERPEGYQFSEYGTSELRAARPDAADHIGAFEPHSSSTFLRDSNSPGDASVAFQYGTPESKVVAGDWDEDGYDSIGLFDPAHGLFRLKNQNRNTDNDDDLTPFIYGAAGFVPLAGDWNSDGVDSVGVFDPTTAAFYLRNSNDSGVADAGQFVFGRPGWIPLAGDWDGDGFDGIGVYDPETATFYLRNNLSAGSPDFGPFNFGMPGWKPIAGDWDDDGIVTVGVYNPDTATFFLRNSNSTGVADVPAFNYGAAGWEPIVGDWDPDEAARTNPYPKGRTAGFRVINGDANPASLFGDSRNDYLRGDSAGLREAIESEQDHKALNSQFVSAEGVQLATPLKATTPHSGSFFSSDAIELQNLAYEPTDVIHEESLELLARDQL